MQLTKIKFGTDGWRGVIADDFTFENVRRVAQATANYWNSLVGTQKTAIVGYDNRFLSETYAKLVCEILAANRIKALYPPVAVPTPAVSFAVRYRKLCGAVMITASHNPPQFNGYKLKAHYAGPADPEMCAQVEGRMDQSLVRGISFEEGLKNGDIEIYDPRPSHVAAVIKIIDLKRIREAKLRVVVDSMHGCGDNLLETVLEKSACRVETIRAERDPLFGGVNPEPTGKNLGALCDAVKKSRAQIGLATDGDADRLGIVDDKGRYVSIQLVFAMLLLHLLRNCGRKSGVVVKSTNSTVLIDRICRAHGLKCVEVPVGFKYICEQMRETDVLIGGEESGGIGFQRHIPERDGILANLMLLEMLAVMKKPLSEIARDLQKEFGASAYDRIDMRFPLEKREKLIETLRSQPPKQLLGVPLMTMKDSDGVKYLAKDDSWLMFRTSGTEPIIRIYSEASNAARVKKLLEHGRELCAEDRKVAVEVLPVLAKSWHSGQAALWNWVAKMVNSATSIVAKLQLISGKLPGRAIDLTQERVNIGRDHGNIICLDHITVSLHHAILVRVGAHYKVRDLISTNGTYVNGQRTMGAELHTGDVLRCGEIEMRYEEFPQPVTELKKIQSRPMLALGRQRSSATLTDAPVVGERESRSWPKRVSVLLLLILACGGATWWFEQWPFDMQGPLKQFARSAELRVYSDPIYRAASAAEDAKDYAKLLENAKLLASRYPQSALAQYILGVAYGKLNFFPDAAAAFQQAIKLKPDYVDAWNNLGWACAHAGRFAEAIVVFQQLTKLTPSDAQVWNSLGDAYTGQRHPADAVAAYKMAVQLKPNSADGYFNLGAAYANQGKHTEAINAFRLALKHDPNFVEAWFNLGVVSEHQGENNEAVLFFQQAIKLKPDYAEAWGGLVKSYLNLRQPDKAGEAAREMKRIDPIKADQLADELSREAPSPPTVRPETE